MAKDEDDGSSSWPSWLTPGDTRGESPHQRPDSNSQHPYQPSDTHDQSSRRESMFNPLIAFKHFVDEHVAAIKKLPSNIAELRYHARERASAYADRDRQAYKSWTGHDNGWDTDLGETSRELLLDCPDEAKAMAEMLINESARRNQPHVVSSEKISALFGDHEFNPLHYIEENSPWPVHYKAADDSPSELSTQLSTQLSTMAASPTRWLSIDWFKHSPYSPMSLEADPELSKHDTKWRHSFEDLLEASLDKRMTSQERIGYRPGTSLPISTWRGPGLDWMLSLQCRGILPPQLPSWYSQHHFNVDHFNRRAMPGHILSWTQQKSKPTGCRAHVLAPPGWLSGHPQTVLDADYYQLVYEIATPSIEDAARLNLEFEATWYLDQPGILSPRTYESHIPEFMIALAERELRRMLLADVDEADPSKSDEVNGGLKYYLDMLNKLDKQDRKRLLQQRPIEDEGDVLYADHARSVMPSQLEEFGMTPRQLDVSTAEERKERGIRECPDEMGRAIGVVARSLDQADTELDFYERLADLESTARRQSGFLVAEQRNTHLTGQISDPLGPAVGDAARRQAARAFADEENGLSEDDAFERFERLLVSEDEVPATLRDIRALAECDQTLLEEIWQLRDSQRLLRDDLDNVSRAQLRVQKAMAAKQESEQRQTPPLLEQDAHSHGSEQAPDPTVAGNSRPQVLSTLTTTQTTRLPDGSVKTTVILKRRFADGREETQESTQTSFDQTAAGDVDGQASPKDKKGWFWS